MSNTIYEKASETAQKIRVELKKAFPEIPARHFKVKSNTYAGGSSISVNFEDYPSWQEVEDITRKFASSSYDGMQDLQESHGYAYKGQKFNGADYVSVSKTYSTPFREANKELKEYFKEEVMNGDFLEDLDKNLNYIGKRAVRDEDKSNFKYVKFNPVVFDINFAKAYLTDYDYKIVDAVVAKSTLYETYSDVPDDVILDIINFAKTYLESNPKMEASYKDFYEFATTFSTEIAELYLDKEKAKEIELKVEFDKCIEIFKDAGLVITTKKYNETLKAYQKAVKEGMTQPLDYMFIDTSVEIGDIKLTPELNLIVNQKIELFNRKIKNFEDKAPNITNELGDSIANDIHNNALEIIVGLFNYAEPLDVKLDNLKHIGYYLNKVLEVEVNDIIAEYYTDKKNTVNRLAQNTNLTEDDINNNIPRITKALYNVLARKLEDAGIEFEPEVIDNHINENIEYITRLYNVEMGKKSTYDEARVHILSKCSKELLNIIQNEILGDRMYKKSENPKFIEAQREELLKRFETLAELHLTSTEIEELVETDIFKNIIESNLKNYPIEVYENYSAKTRKEKYFEKISYEFENFIMDNLENGFDEYQYNKYDKVVVGKQKMPFAVYREYLDAKQEYLQTATDLANNTDLEEEAKFKLSSKIQNQYLTVIDEYFGNEAYVYEIPREMYANLDEITDLVKYDLANPKDSKVVKFPTPDEVTEMNFTKDIKKILLEEIELADIAYKAQSVFTVKDMDKVILASKEFKDVIATFKMQDIEDKSVNEELKSTLKSLVNTAFSHNVKAIYMNTLEKDLINNLLNDETKYTKTTKILKSQYSQQFLEYLGATDNNYPQHIALKEIPITKNTEEQFKAKEKNAEKLKELFVTWFEENHKEVLVAENPEESLADFIEKSINEIKTEAFNPFTTGRLVNDRKDTVLGKDKVVTVLNQVNEGEFSQRTEAVLALDYFKKTLEEEISNLANSYVNFTSDEIQGLLNEAEKFMEKENVDKFFLFDIKRLKAVIESFNGTYHFSYEKLVPSKSKPTLDEIIKTGNDTTLVNAYGLALVSQIAKNHAIEAIDKSTVKYSSELDFEDDLNRYLKQAKSKAMLEADINKQIPYKYDELVMYASSEVSKLVNAIKVEDKFSSVLVDEITDNIAKIVNDKYYEIVNTVKNQPDENADKEIEITKNINNMILLLTKEISDRGYNVEVSNLTEKTLSEKVEFKTLIEKTRKDLANKSEEDYLKIAEKFCNTGLEIINNYLTANDNFVTENEIYPVRLNSNDKQTILKATESTIDNKEKFKNSNKDVVDVVKQTDIHLVLGKLFNKQILAESVGLTDRTKKPFETIFEEMLADLLKEKSLVATTITPTMVKKYVDFLKTNIPVIVDYLEAVYYQSLMKRDLGVDLDSNIAEHIYKDAFNKFLEETGLSENDTEDIKTLDNTLRTNSKALKTLDGTLKEVGRNEGLLTGTFRNLYESQTTNVQLKEKFVPEILPVLIRTLSKGLQKEYADMLQSTEDNKVKEVKPVSTEDKLTTIIGETLLVVNRKLNDKYFIQGEVTRADLENPNTVLVKTLNQITKLVETRKFTLKLRAELVKNLSNMIYYHLNKDLKEIVTLNQTIPEKYKPRYEQTLKGAVGRQTKKGKLNPEFVAELEANLFTQETINNYFFSDVLKTPTVVLKENLNNMDKYVEDKINAIADVTEIREVKTLKGKAKVAGISNNNLKNYIKLLALDIMTELERNRDLQVTNEDKLNIVKYYSKRANIIHFTDIANDILENDSSLSLKEVMSRANKEEINYFVTTGLIQSIISRNESTNAEKDAIMGGINLSEVLRKANTGIVTIKFLKVNGEVRELKGTYDIDSIPFNEITDDLREKLKELSYPNTQLQKITQDIVPIYDVEKKAFRSFKASRVISVTVDERTTESSLNKVEDIDIPDASSKRPQDMMKDLAENVVRIVFIKKSDDSIRYMYATRNPEVIEYYADKYNLVLTDKSGNRDKRFNDLTNDAINNQLNKDYITVFSLDSKGFRTFKPSLLCDFDEHYLVPSFMVFAKDEIGWEKCLDGEAVINSYYQEGSFYARSDASLNLGVKTNNKATEITEDELKTELYNLSLKAKNTFEVEKGSEVNLTEGNAIANYFVNRARIQEVKEILSSLNNSTKDSDKDKELEKSIALAPVIKQFFESVGYNLLEDYIEVDENDYEYDDDDFEDDDWEDDSDEIVIEVKRNSKVPKFLTKEQITGDISQILNLILVDDTATNRDSYSVETTEDKKRFNLAVENVKKDITKTDIPDKFHTFKYAYLEEKSEGNAQTAYNELAKSYIILVKTEYDNMLRFEKAQKEVAEKHLSVYDASNTDLIVRGLNINELQHYATQTYITLTSQDNKVYNVTINPKLVVLDFEVTDKITLGYSEKQTLIRNLEKLSNKVPRENSTTIILFDLDTNKAHQFNISDIKSFKVNDTSIERKAEESKINPQSNYDDLIVNILMQMRNTANTDHTIKIMILDYLVKEYNVANSLNQDVDRLQFGIKHETLNPEVAEMIKRFRAGNNSYEEILYTLPQKVFEILDKYEANKNATGNVDNTLYKATDSDIIYKNINYTELFHYLDSKDFEVTVSFIKANKDLRILMGTVNEEQLQASLTTEDLSNSELNELLETIKEIRLKRFSDLSNKKVVRLYEIGVGFRQFKPQNLISFTVKNSEGTVVVERQASDETSQVSTGHYNPENLTASEMYEILKEKVVRVTVAKDDGNLRTLLVTKNSDLLKIYYQRDIEKVKFNPKSLEKVEKTPEESKSEQLSKDLFTVLELGVNGFKTFRPSQVQKFDELGEITTWLEFNIEKDAWFDIAFEDVDAKQFETLGSKVANDSNYPSNAKRKELEAEYLANNKAIEAKLEKLKADFLARKANHEEEETNDVKALTADVIKKRLAITNAFVKQAQSKIIDAGGFVEKDLDLYDKIKEVALALNKEPELEVSPTNKLKVKYLESHKLIMVEYAEEVIFLNPRYALNGVSMKVYADTTNTFKFGRGKVITTSKADSQLEPLLSDLIAEISRNVVKNELNVKLDAKDLQRIQRIDTLINSKSLKKPFVANLVNAQNGISPHFLFTFKDKKGSRNLLVSPSYVFDFDSKKLIYKRESYNTTLKDFNNAMSAIKPNSKGQVLNGINAEHFSQFVSLMRMALNLRTVLPKE